MSSILVVDDKDSVRKMLSETLLAEGHEVETAKNGHTAIEKARQGRFDVVLTDLKMPEMDGLEVLARIKEADPLAAVIVMTAYGTIEDAVTAMKQGAYDFLTKPFDPARLTVLIDRVLQNRRLQAENELLREELAQRMGYNQIIGSAENMKEVERLVKKVAGSDTSVLFEGESGTGKELFAAAIHHLSPRRDKPYVTINCAAIPRELLENELFGSEAGAFTSSQARKLGKFEIADGGTVFLDEVGDMDMSLQAKLLRFLQQKTFERLGGTKTFTVDVRVIAATNRLLPDMVAQGQFREDLYYRINVINIHVPPLREHREDIPLLVDHFFENMGRSNGSRPRIMPEAYAALSEYSWPGNVRELANVIERMLVSGCGPEIGTDDVPIEVRTQRSISLRPKRERRRTVADDLLERMTVDHESFWTAVYPLYMQREITRANLRELVSKGLEEAKGNYKIVTKLFNLDPGDYKRFLNFLRKHECQVPFKDYR